MDQFQAFKTELEGQLGDNLSASALASLELATWDDSGVVLNTDTQTEAERMTQVFGADIQRAFENQFGPVSRLRVTASNDDLAAAHLVDNSEFAQRVFENDLENKSIESSKMSNLDQQSERVQSAGERVVLRAGKTLDRYCVNETNRVARHAVMRLLDGTSVPVTYIYGTTGRGKTHLLNAVALEWLRRHPTGRLIYLHYDTLVADISDAFLTNGIKELKLHLQDTDILVLDDVHLLRGRKRTQEELGCLIDRLTQAGKTVLIAGAVSPKVLAETGICGRLSQRLMGGMSVELKAPDYELRLRIANQWAEDFRILHNISVPQRHIDMIAWRCDASVREIEGALIRLEMEMDSVGGELSDDKVRAMLSDVAAARAPEASIEAIFDFTAEVFGVSRSELSGKSRKQPIVRARQAFCMTVRKLTDTPLAAIGAVVHRDHTTVMHSVEKAEIISEQDSVFADRVSQIMERFQSP